MAKLIFTSRYLKDAKPSQKENYVHYIGTRKGVEKIDTSKKYLPATVSQKKLVHQLLGVHYLKLMVITHYLMVTHCILSLVQSKILI